ncbi:MAG: PAS domain S-box protein [Anaerolineae bacterium]|nr:PAS domain S-box protein [Anaerolineae bacterium]
MGERRRITLLIVIMALIAVIVSSITIVVLYNTSLEQQRERLVEIAQSRARLIEVMARHESDYQGTPADQLGETTLHQLQEAHTQFMGFGDTGEFTLAKLENDHIVFLLSHRHDILDTPENIPFDSELAEPMQRALSGESGTVIGLDYRGERVLAAYEPVRGLGLGIVAKIDMVEVQAPFVRAGIMVGISTLVFVVIGTLLFRNIGTPLVASLEKSEALYRGTFERAATGIAHADLTGKLIKINPAFCEIVGYTPEELLTMSFEDVTHPEDLKIERPLLKAIVNGESETYVLEKRYIRKGGSPIWVQLNVSLVRDEERQPQYTIGVVSDITGRKAAEKDRQARERQQAALARLGQMALSDISIQDLTDEATRLVAETLEVEYSKVLEVLDTPQTLFVRSGMGWDDGYVGKIWTGTDTESQAGYTLKTDKPVIVEDLATETRFSGPPLLTNHGVTSGISVIIPGQEKPYGVLGAHTRQRRTFTEHDANFMQSVANVLAEAVERKRKENQLRAYSGQLEEMVEQRTAELVEAKDRVETILNNTPDGVLLLGPEGLIETCNPAISSLFGYTPEEILHKSPTLLIASQHQESLNHVLERFLTRRQTERLEMSAQRKDTSLFDADIALAAIKDAGTILGAVFTVRDISRSKEVERMKDEFLATAAHELRTPLTSIRGFSEILLTRDLTNERANSYLQMINNQSTHLARIIDDLLDISRLEAGNALDLNREPVDINKLILEVVQPFLDTSPNHRFVLNLEGDCPLVYGDPFRLNQVIQNLISNAVKYSPNGGEITTSSCTNGQMLEVSVKDEGIGMTAEQQKHIYDRFFRADASNTSIGGTGLGLTISKMIVEMHGGHLTVDSQHKRGSRFIFTLPMDRESAP